MCEKPKACPSSCSDKRSNLNEPVRYNTSAAVMDIPIVCLLVLANVCSSKSDSIAFLSIMKPGIIPGASHISRDG